MSQSSFNPQTTQQSDALITTTIVTASSHAELSPISPILGFVERVAAVHDRGFDRGEFSVRGCSHDCGRDECIGLLGRLGVE